MKFLSLTTLLLYSLISCENTTQDSKTIKKYSHNVGDILFNSNTDNTNFTLCDSTKVISGRSTLRYSDSENTISEICFKKFKFQSEYETYNGYAIVRFLVNCKKETGRFRIQTLDWDFSLQECPIDLQNHLISIVKELNEWEDSGSRGKGSDRSKFINFKITNGKIENVLQ